MKHDILFKHQATNILEGRKHMLNIKFNVAGEKFDNEFCYEVHIIFVHYSTKAYVSKNSEHVRLFVCKTQTKLSIFVL